MRQRCATALRADTSRVARYAARSLEAIRLDVTRILMNSELRMPDPVSMPDLPDFLTGHIDPLTGLDNSADGDGSELRPELFGSLAGSPRAARGRGRTRTDRRRVPPRVGATAEVHVVAHPDRRRSRAPVRTAASPPGRAKWSKPTGT